MKAKFYRCTLRSAKQNFLIKMVSSLTDHIAKIRDDVY